MDFGLQPACVCLYFLLDLALRRRVRVLVFWGPRPLEAARSPVGRPATSRASSLAWISGTERCSSPLGASSSAPVMAESSLESMSSRSQSQSQFNSSSSEVDPDLAYAGGYWSNRGASHPRRRSLEEYRPSDRALAPAPPRYPWQ